MSCLEHDEHYIVTFPNGYGRLAHVIVLLPTVQGWCGGERAKMRGGAWGRDRKRDGRRGKTEGERERGDFRIFIANFLYIKGTCRESIKQRGNGSQWL